MSDFQVSEYDPDAEVEADETEGVESDDDSVESEDAPEASSNGEQASAGANVPQTQKRQKDDLPEGWITPTGLRHMLHKLNVIDTTPQQCYGWVKNGKGFPHQLHTDGRFIVPVPAEGAEGHGDPEKDAVAWVRRQLEKRVEREANKRAKAAEAAAKATPAEETAGDD